MTSGVARIGVVTLNVFMIYEVPEWRRRLQRTHSVALRLSMTRCDEADRPRKFVRPRRTPGRIKQSLEAMLRGFVV